MQSSFVSADASSDEEMRDAAPIGGCGKRKRKASRRMMEMDFYNDSDASDEYF